MGAGRVTRALLCFLSVSREQLDELEELSSEEDACTPRGYPGEHNKRVLEGFRAARLSKLYKTPETPFDSLRLGTLVW